MFSATQFVVIRYGSPRILIWGRSMEEKFLSKPQTLGAASESDLAGVSQHALAGASSDWCNGEALSPWMECVAPPAVAYSL